MANSREALNENRFLSETTVMYEDPHGTLPHDYAVDAVSFAEHCAENKFGRLEPAQRALAALSELERLMESNRRMFNPIMTPNLFALLPYIGFTDNQLSHVGSDVQRYINGRRNNEVGLPYEENIHGAIAQRRQALVRTLTE